MPGETVTTTYSIPEPFDSALKLVRSVLARAGLSILAELDVSGRIEQSLGIGIARCNVLYVCSKRSLLESINIRPAVGIFLPLHVVVSARGGQTEIYLLASPTPNGGNPAPALAAPVNKLQDEISRAMEKIAMHRSYCQLGLERGSIN
jgi:uncharacterized protein (DUF302 family)